MDKFLVLEFNEDRLSSLCKVLESDHFYIGQEVWIDLTVNADFGETSEIELVGKTVAVDGLQACEYIGIGVKLVELCHEQTN